MSLLKASKILIISYTFPPQGGVGGRRWAKLAKYFYRDGVDIHVITTPPGDHSSLWTKDTVEYKDRITYVTDAYPAILRLIPSTVIQKIRYRLATWFMKIIAKGNYYDWSQGWERNLIGVVESFIEKDYTTIIATAGPFHYLFPLALLKGKYGDRIKLIADFRDPWTNNKTAFGYSALSSRRLSREKFKEKVVVDSFDRVICVAPQMTEYFKRSSVADDEQFETFINGFDPDDVCKTSSAEEEILSAGIMNFTFVGTLYDKTLRHVKALCAAIESSGIDQSRFSFNFYGSMNDNASTLLSMQPCIKLNGPVNLSHAEQIILESDLCMLFLTDDLTYSFSTKFCEYVARNKPIWVVSKPGITPEFVKDQNIGFVSTPDEASIQEFLKSISSNPSMLKSINYDNFNSNRFNLSSIAREYLSFIEASDPRQPV